MKVTNLYKYRRSDDGVTVSPIKPDGVEYTAMVRLIADDGKALTRDGVELTPCCDVESADGWYEVDSTSSGEATTEDLYNALSEMGVDVS